MVDVDGSSVVVLKRCTDCNIVKPVEVEIRHRSDGRTKPGATWFVFISAAG